MSKNLKLKGEKLPYSNYISCVWKVEGQELEIYLGRDSRTMPFATRNLQTDSANFESIAFCVWAIYPECKVILRYEPLKWYQNENVLFPLDYEAYDECLEWIVIEKRRRKENDEDDLNDSVEARMQHYMRFLYRVMKMQTLYGTRFTVDSSNQYEVELFTKEFLRKLDAKELIITTPETGSNSRKAAKISENHLEKWFVHYSATAMIEKKCPEFAQSQSGNIKVYDQFPCGVFADRKLEINRIFSRGFFDLWGVDSENNLCLYELKEYKNSKLGIISELFFYSCLLTDFKKMVPSEDSNERGFQNFLSANDAVTAYFLAPKYHSFIERNKKEILFEMNKRGDNVKYDLIQFSQENIVGDSEEAFLREVASFNKEK